MKQHITADQLNELSDKGKERLREWWQPEEGDFVSWPITELPSARSQFVLTSSGDGMCDDLSDSDFNKEVYNPLLSIGQMIEFLDEKYEEISKAVSIEDASFSLVREGTGWSVGDLNDPHGPDSYMYNTSWVYLNGNLYPELCDALWEAVKEVLDNK